MENLDKRTRVERIRKLEPRQLKEPCPHCSAPLWRNADRMRSCFTCGGRWYPRPRTEAEHEAARARAWARLEPIVCEVNASLGIGGRDE